MSQEQHNCKQSRIIRERARALFQRGKESIQTNDLLWQAFDELAVALEMLERAEARATACEEQRLHDIETLEALNCHYRELFQYAPAAYLITSLEGTIREANAVAATLLHTDEQRLIGRSLAFFLPNGERRAFQQRLAQIRNTTELQTWEQCLRTWDGPPIKVMAQVAVARGQSGQPQAFRWMLYELPVDVQSIGLKIAMVREDHVRTRPSTLDGAMS